MAELQPELADGHEANVQMRARELRKTPAQVRTHQRAADDQRQGSERIARSLSPHLVGDTTLECVARSREHAQVKRAGQGRHRLLGILPVLLAVGSDVIWLSSCNSFITDHTLP